MAGWRDKLSTILQKSRASRVSRRLTRDAVRDQRAAEEIDVAKANPWPRTNGGNSI
jgi:hypothetical protein